MDNNVGATFLNGMVVGAIVGVITVLMMIVVLNLNHSDQTIVEHGCAYYPLVF